MSEFVDAVVDSARESLAKEIGKKIAGGIVLVAGFLGVSLWAYIAGARPYLIAMYLSVGFPVATLALLSILIAWRNLTDKRASLAIEYDPKFNLLPMGMNASDVRLFVRNKSHRHAAQRLRVKVERLIPIGENGADPQAGQFNNFLAKLERFEHGKDDLPAHENVEVMGPVTYASNKDFFFRSDEPAATQGRYYCKPGTYRMTLFAIADNADPVRGQFIVSEKNGALHMEWEKDAA
jgi:hypothetical protein